MIWQEIHYLNWWGLDYNINKVYLILEGFKSESAWFIPPGMNIYILKMDKRQRLFFFTQNMLKLDIFVGADVREFHQVWPILCVSFWKGKMHDPTNLF